MRIINSDEKAFDEMVVWVAALLDWSDGMLQAGDSTI